MRINYARTLVWLTVLMLIITKLTTNVSFGWVAALSPLFLEVLDFSLKMINKHLD